MKNEKKGLVLTNCGALSEVEWTTNINLVYRFDTSKFTTAKRIKIGRLGP